MLWRRIGAVIAGLVVAFLLVQVAELLVHQLYPPPPGTNLKDFSEVKKFVIFFTMTIVGPRLAAPAVRSAG